MYRFAVIRFERRSDNQQSRICDIKDIFMEQRIDAAEGRAKRIIKAFPKENCEVWDGKTGRCVWRE